MEKLNENYKSIMLYRPYNGNQSGDWTNSEVDVEQYTGDAVALFITGDPDGIDDADTDAVLVHKIQGTNDLEGDWTDLCESEPIGPDQSGLAQQASFDISKYKFIRSAGVITGTGQKGYNPCVVIVVKVGVAGAEVEAANADGDIQASS